MHKGYQSWRFTLVIASHNRDSMSHWSVSMDIFAAGVVSVHIANMPDASTGWSKTA